ncbi:phosphotransferase family protein [Brevibacterium atlanticum]|uniref:hypothetical protein n=1 Tax=Brevibacterium atlanticum TaxID=2697563 RepID=UPI0014200C66|nr:hypothetical protein [Brevibacterium atlanticum]
MTATSCDQVDADFANLPYVGQLRSATALSRRLGFAVRPVRIRIKPGRSVIVAWRRKEAGRLGAFADWGFTAVMTSPDKLANAQRRAARNGQELTVHEAADPRAAGATGAVLISGGVLADPRIGKHIVRALDHLGGDIEIIGYNPARRLLLKHTPIDGPPEFVRIGAGSQRHLAEAADRWQRAQLPSLPVEFIGRRQTATRSPWWGTGDLCELPDPSVAEEVGMIVAELHRAEPEPVNERVTDDPIDQAEDTVRTLARLVPERGPDLDELRVGLRRRLQGQVDAGGPGAGGNGVPSDGHSGEWELREIHGDLSPDQVLVCHSEWRIVDLDRSAIGPIGMDLGRWVAACRRHPGLHDLEHPFLYGYRSAGGTDVDLGAWTAWALVVAGLEPWRSCSKTWQAETMRIIDAARSALGDGSMGDVARPIGADALAADARVAHAGGEPT